jgi:hypothetical protein
MHLFARVRDKFEGALSAPDHAAALELVGVTAATRMERPEWGDDEGDS